MLSTDKLEPHVKNGDQEVKTICLPEAPESPLAQDTKQENKRKPEGVMPEFQEAEAGGRKSATLQLLPSTVKTNLRTA